MGAKASILNRQKKGNKVGHFSWFGSEGGEPRKGFFFYHSLAVREKKKGSLIFFFVSDERVPRVGPRKIKKDKKKK